jgi:chorismate mutase
MTASATADSASSHPSHAAVPGDPGEPLLSVPVTAPAALSSAVAAENVGQPTPAGVRSGRAQIDDLDARILALITERVHTAAGIQAARIADGGRRLDLKRETEIIARYRAALGRPGVTVALAVLELCRGRV